VARPGLLEQLAGRFGRQCTVLAVDAAADGKGAWQVVVESGKRPTGLDVVGWAATAVGLGAGEILLTSWDRDGTRSGYEVGLLSAVASAVNVPVIASGGADRPQHLLDALRAGADAVLAASIFHESDLTVGDIKRWLTDAGVEVRP
jgi:imidazoleglycerol phosphate synthase cyclase subunit